jgi:1-acyl-sn-glycerol-3-phosphate acyltransferase
MVSARTYARIGNALIGTFMNIALRTDTVQHTPLPEGPKLIAFNHPSTTDPIFMLPVVREPMTILVTEMAFKTPVLGELIRRAGHIPVVADNGRMAFNEAIARLRAGETIGICPEGALSPAEGGLCRPRTGAVRLALEANVPVIPVGIALDRSRLLCVDTVVENYHEEARYYLNGPYAVTFGQALTFNGNVNDWAYVRGEAARLLEHIGRLAHESARRLAPPATAFPMPVVVQRP